ncbi:arsenate reductase [Companilactobacillus mindensis DSM 14500]|uniref:Arsenate reductase n=2 Tax=Companilactobacillus mindensis TaxID=167481 RepID=A0A0R1QDR9_9LACO|nr:arsenate reductase [Companilactobacillus mindensis DSM 14500]
MVCAHNAKSSLVLKTMKPSIYFLSSNDSLRSQIAVGYAKKYLKDWDIKSGGVRSDAVEPLAIEVMAEDGIDISQQKSTKFTNDSLQGSDIVITLCGEARDKLAIPQDIRWLHWPFIDPDLVAGSKEEKLATYREVRDSIKQNIQKFATQK